MRTVCNVKSYKKCSKSSFSALTQAHNCFVFPLVYFIALSITRCSNFEVSPEIRCSGASSHYCCYGNHTAGSKPILKLFVISVENSIRYLLPRIVIKCYELVKLCRIIRSGPVFWDTVYLSYCIVSNLKLWSLTVNCSKIIYIPRAQCQLIRFYGRTMLRRQEAVLISRKL